VEDILGRASSGNRRWVRHEIRRWIHLPGHDVSVCVTVLVVLHWNHHCRVVRSGVENSQEQLKVKSYKLYRFDGSLAQW